MKIGFLGIEVFLFLKIVHHLLAKPKYILGFVSDEFFYNANPPFRDNLLLHVFQASTSTYDRKTWGRGFPSLFISRGCEGMVTGNCLKNIMVIADEQ